jgi:ABC-type branched-subunit amino acid transport system ATPase component
MALRIAHRCARRKSPAQSHADALEEHGIARRARQNAGVGLHAQRAVALARAMSIRAKLAPSSRGGDGVAAGVQHDHGQRLAARARRWPARLR